VPYVITNFLLILTVKNFENRLIFDNVKVFNTNCHFLAYPVPIVDHEIMNSLY